VYLPTLRFHGLYVHKVCCYINLVSPPPLCSTAEVYLLTCIIPNTVPLINLVLYDLTTKVLGGNAEVGKGTLNLPLLYRYNFRDEGKGIFPSYLPITQQFILSLS
jgi:hypothetical protein